MLSSAVRDLFRRSSSRPSEQALPTLVPAVAEPKPQAEAPMAEARIQTAWPAARLALTNNLWGAGFIFPGGEIETLRLTRPLGLSAAASLLIVGVGSGGPASAVARNLGAWVTGMDTDPSLLAAARGMITRAQLTKKVSIKAWDPDNPVFEAKSHHHCLALESFHGARPEPILDGLARALKPGGQMVLTELAAPEPLDRTDPTVRRWAELERRDPAHILAPARRDPHVGACRPRCPRRRGHVPTPSGARDARLARAAARPRPQTQPAGGRATGARRRNCGCCGGG